jgi:hypothetical protein
METRQYVNPGGDRAGLIVKIDRPQQLYNFFPSGGLMSVHFWTLETWLDTENMAPCG